MAAGPAGPRPAQQHRDRDGRRAGRHGLRGPRRRSAGPACCWPWSWPPGRSRRCFGSTAGRPIAGVAWLVATWAVMGLCIGAWLLPALEPYRMARRVGERLAAVSARLRLEPVLLTFQEPSTDLRLGPPGPDDQGLGRPLRAAPAAWRGDRPLMPHELEEFDRPGRSSRSSPARR